MYTGKKSIIKKQIRKIKVDFVSGGRDFATKIPSKRGLIM
jgi:hypothetical protein